MSTRQKILKAALKELRSENEMIQRRRNQRDIDLALARKDELMKFGGSRGPFYNCRKWRRA